MFKAVPATSLFQAIRRVLGIQDAPLVDASRLLPAPKSVTVTAATWDRERHPCPVCGQEMTKNLFPSHPDTSPYFCLPCDQAIANEAHDQLQTIRSRTGKLHLPTGTLIRMYRQVAAGTYARDMHRAQQQQALSQAEKNIIAALSTKNDLEQTPEISQLATLPQQHSHTIPLPARDITRENSPRNPATPTPKTREALFADVGDVPRKEKDEDITEKRRIVRRTTNTVEIPAIDAEVLLEALRDGKTSDQNTGESERLPAQVNWML